MLDPLEPNEPTIPIMEAAVALSKTREIVLRGITTGRIRGAQVGGFWFVAASEISRLRQPAELVQTLAAEYREKKAEEDAAEAARQERMKKRADADLHGEPLPKSVAPMAMPQETKSND